MDVTLVSAGWSSQTTDPPRGNIRHIDWRCEFAGRVSLRSGSKPRVSCRIMLGGRGSEAVAATKEDQGSLILSLDAQLAN